MELNIDIEKYKNLLVDYTIQYGGKLLIAIIVLLIGLRIVKTIINVLKKSFAKSNMEPTLQTFLASILTWTLKLLLFISVISIVGIETTSFVAVLGAAGLAVGMALQGTLANFAGGVLILILKPFKVGDLVDTQGEFGTVSEIGIFNTILLTPENKTVIIPNGAIMNGNITNVTNQGVLRVDLVIGVSYSADIKKTKEVLINVLTSDEQVLKDPAPFVGVKELADSSVNFVVRPYTDPANYWDVYFRVTENCKLALDEAGIEIPFPQMDVHLDKVN